jgi:hypothetical protein
MAIRFTRAPRLVAASRARAAAVPDGSLPAPRLDLQGSLADATRRAVADIERYKIAEALREAGGDKARAAEILQINFKTLIAKLKESGLDSWLLLEAHTLQRLPQFLRRDVVHDRGGADGGREHEVEAARDDLLVMAHRVEHLSGGDVGNGGQGAEAGDEVGQRLLVTIGEGPARR